MLKTHQNTSNQRKNTKTSAEETEERLVNDTLSCVTLRLKGLKRTKITT